MQITYRVHEKDTSIHNKDTNPELTGLWNLICDVYNNAYYKWDFKVIGGSNPRCTVLNGDRG